MRNRREIPTKIAFRMFFYFVHLPNHQWGVRFADWFPVRLTLPNSWMHFFHVKLNFTSSWSAEHLFPHCCYFFKTRSDFFISKLQALVQQVIFRSWNRPCESTSGNTAATYVLFHHVALQGRFFLLRAKPPPCSFCQWLCFCFLELNGINLYFS